MSLSLSANRCLGRLLVLSFCKILRWTWMSLSHTNLINFGYVLCRGLLCYVVIPVLMFGGTSIPLFIKTTHLYTFKTYAQGSYFPHPDTLLLLLYVCIYQGRYVHKSAEAYKDEKKTVDPLESELQWLWTTQYGCWEPNLGPLKKRDVLTDLNTHISSTNSVVLISRANRRRGSISKEHLQSVCPASKQFSY